MKVNIITSFFLLMLCSKLLKAQINPLSGCSLPSTEILKMVYGNDFTTAQALLDSSCNRPCPEAALMQAHIYRWKHLPIYDQSEHLSRQYLKQLLTVSIREKIDSEYEAFVKLNSYLLLAEFYYNKNETINAVKYASKAYSIIKPKLTTENLPDEWLLITGLYNYFHSHYLAQNIAYNSLLIFFKDGNKTTGLKQLKKAAEGNTIVQVESLIYLAHIYLRLENKPDSALYYAKQLVKKFPANLKLSELYIEAAIASDKVTNEVYPLVNKLMNSPQTYFKKYGVTYNALLKATETPADQAMLESAIIFINDNGGGSHLLSLLYKKLAEIPGIGDTYISKLHDLKVYDYKLTRL